MSAESEARRLRILRDTCRRATCCGCPTHVRSMPTAKRVRQAPTFCATPLSPPGLLGLKTEPSSKNVARCGVEAPMSCSAVTSRHVVHAADTDQSTRGSHYTRKHCRARCVDSDTMVSMNRADEWNNGHFASCPSVHFPHSPDT